MMFGRWEGLYAPTVSGFVDCSSGHKAPPTFRVPSAKTPSGKIAWRFHSPETRLLPFADTLPFSDATATWWCFNPQTTSSMKKFFLTLIAATVLSLGVATAAAAETAPKSVIHVVSVKWKSDATKEQIKAALAGVQALPAAYKAIT